MKVSYDWLQNGKYKSDDKYFITITSEKLKAVALASPNNEIWVIRWNQQTVTLFWCIRSNQLSHVCWRQCWLCLFEARFKNSPKPNQQHFRDTGFATIVTHSFKSSSTLVQRQVLPTVLRNKGVAVIKYLKLVLIS